MAAKSPPSFKMRRTVLQNGTRVPKVVCSCETPFQMASRLRNSRSTLRACLQTTITSSFHLQIAYRLKLWTPDFPRFEKRYHMHNLSSRKCFKNGSNSSEMEVRHFRSWFAQSSSNGHNFSVSNPNLAPFEAVDS